MKPAEQHAKPRRQASKQTTINLTKVMEAEFVSLAKEEFGPRGISRWIEYALHEFISIPDFALRVGAGEANLALPVARAITLTPAAERYLNEAVTIVRKIDPTAENVRAQVLRASFAHAIRAAARPRQGEEAIQIANEVPKLRRRSSARPTSA